MTDQQTLFVKMALDAWNIQIDRTNKLINALSDEELQKEVAPSRNTGTYLLGHLTSVHDGIFPLFGIGDRLHPQLVEPFIKNPDKSSLPKPPLQDLRNFWNEVNEKLADHFNQLTVDEWFEKHTAVSDEDFQKEPHRNKLNVLINRTNHLANHLGQMTFLKSKA
jgi:hypothetical protein